MFLTIERWEYAPYLQYEDDTQLHIEARPCTLGINVRNIASYQRIHAHIMIDGMPSVDDDPLSAVLIRMTNDDIHVVLDECEKPFADALDEAIKGRNVDLGMSRHRAALISGLTYTS
ncbi:hypothetical protein [Chromobacterium sp. ASV23]|uniref:hypothetical protein n=1 Tax=Chromobacterium sp. ASV23 TaxID=2795110 RepID=UPI0018EC575D|nr:hypothetical protein [Chromobacterium sp. ASV23]